MSLRPYYQDAQITLYHGDCRELAGSLPKCDALITDPPYNQTKCDWDKWVDGWPSLPIETDQMWCFGTMRMFWDYRDEFLAGGWKFGQDLVWEKHNGSNLLNDRFRRVHESPVHFFRGNWGTLYKEVPTVTISNERKNGSARRTGAPQHFGQCETGPAYLYDGTRLQRSVIHVRSCHGHAENETQKPPGIVKPLMDYSVPIGGLVIDWFSGSGTTLVVAKESGKRAIGIDSRESQCEIAARRLQEIFV